MTCTDPYSRGELFQYSRFTSPHREQQMARSLKERNSSQYPANEPRAHKYIAKGITGGSWTPCDHLVLYGLNFDDQLGEALRVMMTETQSSTALEFGCGIGIYVSYLAQHVPGAQNVVGIDPALMQVEGMPSLFTEDPSAIS